jgi:hypothetical protein
MVAIFIKSTGMHEKPKMTLAMEDGGAERAIQVLVERG